MAGTAQNWSCVLTMKMRGTGHCPSNWLPDMLARKADGDQTDHVRRFAAELQNDARAERKTGQGKRQIGIAGAQQGQRGAGVFHFTDAVVICALAQVDAAIVEAQYYRSGASQPARGAIDHFVVHGAAVLRGADGRPERRGADQAVFGFFEQRFQLLRAGPSMNRLSIRRGIIRDGPSWSDSW